MLPDKKKIAKICEERTPTLENVFPFSPDFVFYTTLKTDNLLQNVIS